MLDKVLPVLIEIIMPFSVAVALFFFIKAIVVLVKALYSGGYINRANIVLLALFFIFLISIGIWTSTSNSCGSCHVMRADALSLQNSVHQGIPCYRCHRDPGAVSALATKLKTLKMIAATATGVYANPVRAFVPDKRCLACHNDILRKNGRANGIKVRHRDFAGKLWNCVDCHIATAHGEVVPVQNPPSMSKCFKCHNDIDTSAKCGICHEAGINKESLKRWKPWQRAHGQDWQKLHGSANSTICIVCHKAQFCSNCHIQMPHPASFNEQHGGEAKAPRRNKCMNCHVESTCKNCHKLDLPHPVQFKTSHKLEIKKLGKEVCDRCHTAKSCENCHAYHKAHPKKGGKK